MRSEPSRRQEKVARVIKEAVSDIIANRLSDPRIQGFVTVTEVDISPDLKNAEVLLSIMTDDEKVSKKTFVAIEHASRHIQQLTGQRLTSKFCPHLHFREDKKFKKTLKTLQLIENMSKELKEKDAIEKAEGDLE